MKRICCIALLFCAVSANAGWWHRGRGFTVSTNGAAAWVAPTNGLLAYWSLDGDATADFGGKDLTLAGTTKPALTNGVADIVDTAYYMDVDHDDIDGESLFYASDALWNFGTGDFTLSCWFYATGSTFGGFMAHRNSGGAAGYAVHIRNTGAVSFYTRQSSVQNVITTDGAYNDSTWYHVAAVKTNTVLMIYIDGILVKSNTGVSDNTDNNEILTIGLVYSDRTDNVLDGAIDEPRIYGRGLTSNEVVTLSQQFD